MHQIATLHDQKIIKCHPTFRRCTSVSTVRRPVRTAVSVVQFADVFLLSAASCNHLTLARVVTLVAAADWSIVERRRRRAVRRRTAATRRAVLDQTDCSVTASQRRTWIIEHLLRGRSRRC